MHKITILLAALFVSFQLSAQTLVTNLRCEMLENPEGIDTNAPRLSWQLDSKERAVSQTHYQIMVSSSAEKLSKEDADVWNSGKTASGQNHLISYAGKPLVSGMPYFWKVKVWTTHGESKWSKASRWSIGLLNASDWKAKWIGYDHASAWDSISQWSRLSARYFRKEFETSKKIKRATVYVSGLGLYKLYINGSKIGNNELAPAPSDYAKQLYYNTFDVTSNLKSGKNAIGVTLGNGRFFTMRQNYKTYKIRNWGFPKLLLQLNIEYTDGTSSTQISDESWRFTADGPIRTNNEYDGEEYDATKELGNWNNTGFDDSKWNKPELVAAPGGLVKAQMSEPMRQMKEVKPISITELKPGVCILDMGQNFAGWLKISTKGKRGDTITLRFSESLQADGSLYRANFRDAKSTDKYILKGSDVENWEPSFVYHGFRYVEISGYAAKPSLDNFVGKLVYDDLQNTGTFESSNSTLNQLFKNAWWGIASNYKGMPVDCPQRNERQPWLGDRATGSYGESFLFDNAKLYAKWLDDIEYSQTDSGQIPDVAPPYWNYYSDNVTWPGTYMLVANMLYRQYGDRQSIVKHYSSMRKWMVYFRRKYSSKGLITKDQYGDWCVPPESKKLIHSKDSSRITNGELISSAYYYYLLTLMQNFAQVSGNNADVLEYASWAKSLKDSFNAKFLDPKTLKYSNNTVTANLLPLSFGMVPDSLRAGVFANVSEKIIREQKSHISTGLVGTQWLMRGLTSFDRADVAYQIATNRDYPSWGYMLENGATAIWELWNGNTADPKMNSLNHVMLLGDLFIWYYENLAGIKSTLDAPGFQRIEMNPSVVDGLSYVKASYKSVQGEIKSEWHKTPAQFSWNISIPANSSAIVYIPANSENEVTEGGKPASSAVGVKFLRFENRKALFEVASGNYSFVSDLKWKAGIIKDEFIFERSSFPESHGSTIAETPKGIVVAWFGGTKEANKDCAIYVSRNENGKWTEPQEVANGIKNDTFRLACWNPVLYQVPGGDLLLFYKEGTKVATWSGWMISSKDNGVTWSKPTALPNGYLGPVKNKPVLLANGMLICPTSTETDGWKVHFELSPDFGKTWSMVGPINDGKELNAIQPSILFHKDGRLQVLCRSKNCAILESWSADTGKTWSPMKATSLPNNNSGTDAVTLSDGRQLLVYNHVLPPKGKTKGPRSPINVSVSKDGTNWDAALVLEDSPISQYSYPSVIQSKDGMVHIVYTWRRQRIKYVMIDPSKLQPVKIENGVWPGAKAESIKNYKSEE